MGLGLDVFTWSFLSYGVISGLEILHLDGSARPGHYIFFHTIAGNVEWNSLDFSILGSFYDLQGSCSDFKGKIAFYRFRRALYIKSNYILIGVMRPVFRAAGDHAGDGGRQLFFSSNGAEFGFICRDVQLIAADRKIHARIAYGEIAQHIVFIHQRGFIFSIALVILQGIGVCSNCAGIIGGKGRDRMVSHHIFPQFAEDRFGRRAISRQAVDDSLFICCPQLVVGNEPDQRLRGDVFVDSAAAILGAL